MAILPVIWFLLFLYVPFSDKKATFSSKTLLARLGRNGRSVPASLAAEAKELAKSVRAILEADCESYIIFPSIFLLDN